MIIDQTLEYYQKRAGEYDHIYLRDDPGRQAELARLYDLSRQLLAGRDVLDVACGTGFWTRVVSQTAKAVVGIDVNPATLAEAKRKSYACPVSFVWADIRHLPIKAEGKNGLLATYIASHVRREELRHLGQVLADVLTPGSPAFLCDNNLFSEMIPELIWDDRHQNTYKKRRLENGEEYIILKNYFEADELEAIFSGWGTIERIVYDTYYWAVALRMRG